MRGRLPPLNAVRAFEAAARHESFALAADELAVTPSAVSQQVKVLEQFVGQALFDRKARGLRLNAAGRRYLPALTGALDAVAQATRAMAAGLGDRTLTVATLGSFAGLWLAPRLPGFERFAPDVDVRLATSNRLVDLVAEGVDVAIRYGSGAYPGLEAQRLMDETVTPVCAPALAKRLTRMEDLADVALLHDTAADARASCSWSAWLRAHGVGGVEAERGPGSNNSAFLVQAAIAERGVMLGRSVLVADALAAGVLVKPFESELPAGFSYWFLTLPGALAQRKVRLFRDWLVAAVERSGLSAADA
jgi:LysR family glycine cleavage system transcriptional activator